MDSDVAHRCPPTNARHREVLDDLGLDDASLDAQVEEAIRQVGPDVMRRAIDTLSQRHRSR